VITHHAQEASKASRGGAGGELLQAAKLNVPFSLYGILQNSLIAFKNTLCAALHFDRIYVDYVDVNSQKVTQKNRNCFWTS
jgi:hypothetical protein